MKTMANELGYSTDAVRALVERHCNVHKTILYNNEHSEILILNWCKYNWTSSKSLLESIEKQIKDVCTPEYKDMIMELVIRVQGGDPPHTLPTPSGDPSISISISNSNSISNKERNTIPPTTEMVDKYCKENNYPIDAEYFCDYYQTRGWKVGKGKMKDWQSAIRTWVKRDKDQKKTDTVDDKKALFEKYKGEKYVD